MQPLTRIVPPLILLSPTTNHMIVQVARSEARVDVRLLDCACIAPDQVFCSPLRVLLHSLRLTSRTLQFVVLGEQGWLAVYDFRCLYRFLLCFHSFSLESRTPNVGVASCHSTAVEHFSSGRLAVQPGASTMLHVAGVDGHIHVR